MPMNNHIPSGPIYSVDFHSEASGKRVGASKRRIRWRFGFANVQALNQGLTGVDCRGEEHEVVLVWSLTSGKRLVIADGQEVHFSMGRRAESKFETTFSMFGNHIFKIVAYAAPPLTPQPGFRQFDLQMDGMSFGTFTKIFELGFRSAPPRRLAREQYSMTAYHNSDESRDFAMSPDNRFEYEVERRRTPVPITPEAAPRTAVKNVEAARAPAPPVVATAEDILSTPNNNTNDQGDLLWDAAPQLTYQPPAQQQQQQYQQAPVQSNAVQTYYQPQVTPQTNNNNYYHQQSPRGVADEFAPVPPPPRTFQDLSKEILSAYTPDPSIPALTYTPHYSNEVYNASSGMATMEERGAKDVTPENNKRQNNAVLVPTMQPLSIVEMQERDQPPLSEMEKAVKTLVNLDDITETLETPEQVKTVRNKERHQPAKSKPLPPSKPAWNLGLRPCLGDMQQDAQPKAAPKKEIMRTHAFDPAAVQAGMMVLYGATTTASSSIPAASGFGAGVYYNNWQQQQQHQRMYAAY